VPAPFPAERAAWLRAIKAPGQHSLFFFSSGTPRFGGYTYGTGPVTLADVCRVTLGLYPYEIEAEPGVLRSQIPEGDYVVDRRAPRARTAAALEDLCRTQLMLRLRLSLKDVEQKVVVARGEFRRDPAAKPETPIELADDAGRTGPQRGGGQLPFGDFLKQLGAYLGRPVLSEVKRMPEGPVTYVVRRALLGEEPLPVEVPSALKHLAAQTGLTFTEETRRVSVLHVRSD
jgi:hypothetical protein